MRAKLTDLMLQRLPYPEKGQAKYWDETVPGFGVRVTQRSKSYFIVYGKRRLTKTLGKYPAMSLKNARQAALAAQKTDTPSVALQSLTTARAAFLEDAEARLRPATITQYRSYLFLLDKKTLNDVKRHDIDTNHPHTVAAWKAFFNWCIRNELTDRNPFATISTKTRERERVLTDDELCAVWAYDAPPFSNYVKLMLLAGLRRGECVHAGISGHMMLVDGIHTKNHRALELPLTPMLEDLLPIPYFNGWSKAKARMDKELQLPHWTLHDLRRTFATIHARIGTPIHVVEAMLNHVSGTISGIAKIYIRHNFLDEARTAQLAYEEHLTHLIRA